jgi:hypothetical protein
VPVVPAVRNAATERGERSCEPDGPRRVKSASEDCPAEQENHRGKDEMNCGPHRPGIGGTARGPENRTGKLAERAAAAGQSKRMSLLAYSFRRAVGAVVVLLVVIWLIQFAVYHITGPGGYIGRGGGFVPFLGFSRGYPPALAKDWNTAALEVGLGLLVLLGIGLAWRLRKRRAT